MRRLRETMRIEIVVHAYILLLVSCFQKQRHNFALAQNSVGGHARRDEDLINYRHPVQTVPRLLCFYVVVTHSTYNYKLRAWAAYWSGTYVYQRDEVVANRLDIEKKWQPHSALCYTNTIEPSIPE